MSEYERLFLFFSLARAISPPSRERIRHDYRERYIYGGEGGEKKTAYLLPSQRASRSVIERRKRVKHLR